MLSLKWLHYTQPLQVWYISSKKKKKKIPQRSTQTHLTLKIHTENIAEVLLSMKKYTKEEESRYCA